ncbi:biotin/lipoyl-binding protein [bacterium]|jgi:acetyl/propionyl-CoA carboxylase alpha subunit|nr:biotin/lipoyl-binding protein [bacterium]|tara:strand:+ start:277 stop:777 length:501 start_codon:yes stop_codon:yes gene_type:complete
MYKITGKQSFDVTPTEGKSEGLLNGDFYSLDIEKVDAQTWHILKDNMSYYVQWIERNDEAKTYTLKINGSLIVLEAKNEFDILLEKMGMANVGSAKVSKLKAPMPGKVLDVLVTVGQEVVKGDGLVILEAMKMENVLKADDVGVVKSVNVSIGEAVEKNNVLIEFE